jgi:hypothetical protein
VRTIVDTVVIHAQQRGQAEDLEAAAVAEHRPPPSEKRVDAAELANRLDAGPLHQVVGIRQHHARAELLELPGRHALHRAVRRHGHEGGRLDHAVCRRQPAAPCAAGGHVEHLEGRGRHVSSIASP